MTAAAAPAIELKGISKAFGPVQANKDISMSVAKGAIHGIVGENGAGKSTLMSILYGFYKADKGEIFINGQKTDIPDSQAAIRAGIGMVHQHFKLVENFTVVENVILGAEDGAMLRPSIAKARKTLQELSEEYGLKVDPDAIIEDLSVGHQQRVEILKQLYRHADILILDEPTGVLTPAEADQLFRILERLKEEGKTIILITHKLREIMEITDTVSVMRRGEMTNTVRTADTSPAGTGRDDGGAQGAPARRKGPRQPRRRGAEGRQPARRARRGGTGEGRVLPDPGGRDPRHRGGCRQRADRTAGGPRRHDPRAGRHRHPAQRADRHLRQAFQRPDAPRARLRPRARGPAGRGPDHALRGVGKRGLRLSPRPEIQLRLPDEQRRHQGRLRRQDGTLRRAPAEPAPARAQLLGRQPAEDRRGPRDGPRARYPLVGQPTRGVDIGAIEFIHKQILALRDQGKAILLVSVELDEIMGLSDRIAVMFDGHIMGERLPSETNENELGLLMAGVTEGAA
jgi:ABC-type multidrug transport system ATPase subunit